nr:hypothetical protein [Desulfobacula sp.]
MKFEAHGTFELSVKGEIVIIRFFHNWNLEGAKAFFTRYRDFLQQLGLKRFGVLSDLRQFGGGTPDAIEFFEKISDWAQENGQAARALIMDSGLKEFTINRIDKGRTRFQVQAFSDEAKALAWFESLGLAVS